MSRLDIFIINYWCADDTTRTIAHIGPKSDWHFWVIDNSDSDAQWQHLEKKLAALNGFHISYERAPSNLGFAKACNLLFAKTQSPFCLLLNPDAQINASAIEALIKDLERDQERAAVAPLMRWLPDEPWWIPSAQSQHWWHSIGLRLIGTHPKIFAWAWQQYYRKQIKIFNTKVFIPQSFVSGAILLIRRSAINALNPQESLLFDEDFFMYFEDADLSLRLLKAGYRIGICPSAIASHTYQHTNHKNALMQTSEVYFAKKWFPNVFRNVLLRLKNLRPPAYLYTPHPSPLTSLDELQNLLCGDELIALSPSPWRMPAIWRHTEHPSVTRLSLAAWNALLPGIYYGVSAIHATPKISYRLISFEKVKSVHSVDAHNGVAALQAHNVQDGQLPT
jgi:GT2 family glycosyltransferase